MSKATVAQSRKLVAYRLLTAQLRLLENTAKTLGKSKTYVVEQALAMYFNRLHIDGVI